MKIGIDVSQIVYGTGVSRYTKNLVEHVLDIDQKNQYVIYGGALRRMPDLRSFLNSIHAKNTKRQAIPISPMMADFFWNRVHRLHIEKLIGKVDVLHTSDWAEPPSRAFKVTTVHDLAPILYPQFTPSKIVDVHTQRLEWVKKESDRIIVPSKAIQTDLIEMGFDANKIRVIPEAPDNIFIPSTKDQIKQVKQKYGIQKNYLLAVGVNPRKNLQRTIDAFRKLNTEKLFELVVVGHPTMQFEFKEGIHVPGHIEDKDMPTVYSGAQALIYPSLYEGFGLPILEAMACKTPVVTSDVGSMKEIGENVAVLVDPESTDSIVKGIRKALTERNDYILKGMKRVKEFSWRKTAEETLKVYGETMEN